MMLIGFAAFGFAGFRAARKSAARGRNTGSISERRPPSGDFSYSLVNGGTAFLLVRGASHSSEG
jgi:hypothetical protein